MNFFKKNLKSILKKLGINVGALRLEEAFKDQLNLFKTVAPSVIFDVGANRGQTLAKYRTAFPHAHIYAFEPYKPVFEELNKNFGNEKQTTLEKVALSDKNGVATFHVNKCHYTNSLFESGQSDEYKNSGGHMDTVEKLNVPTETIDNYSKKHGLEKIGILKMDIQGGELKALQGASDMLSGEKIDLIYTEVEFVKLYKNQPLFHDIGAFLEKFGYQIHNIYNLSVNNSGQLTSADALFVSQNFQKSHAKN